MSVDLREVSATLRQLHLMVDTRLFSDDNWPGDPSVLRRRFAEMGLTTGNQNTSLGNAVHANLFLAFLGGWDEADIPNILEPLNS